MAVTDVAAPPRPDEAPPVAERWPGRLAAAATALTAVLVLFRLGERSLWYDETFGIGVIDRPLGDALWRMAHWEVNQSPFLLLLAGWWEIGRSETFLRLLPAVFAVLAVPAIHVLGRRLAGARVGAVAALLLACHPLAVEWGQQLRAYSLVLLLTIVATHLLLRAQDEPESTGRALAYAAVAALATYTHFFAGLVVGAHALWLLLLRPPPRRLLVSAGVAYGALIAPLGVFFVTRNGDPLSWVASGTRNAAVETAKGLTGGTVWSVLVYGAAVVAGLWAIVPAARQWRSQRDGATWRPAVMLLWLFAPVTVVAVSTATVKPLLEARFLIVVVPALVLLVATGLCRLWDAVDLRPVGAALLVAVLAVSALGVHRWYDRPADENWRGATRLVVRAAEPGAVAVVSPWGGAFALRYYQDRMGLDHHVVTGSDTGFPVAPDPLIEVQSYGATGVPTPFEDAYVAWRDQHYTLRTQEAAGRIVVRTYDRN